jgi:hypothetical protein
LAVGSSACWLLLSALSSRLLLSQPPPPPTLPGWLLCGRLRCCLLLGCGCLLVQLRRTGILRRLLRRLLPLAGPLLA